MAPSHRRILSRRTGVSDPKTVDSYCIPVSYQLSYRSVARVQDAIIDETVIIESRQAVKKLLIKATQPKII